MVVFLLLGVSNSYVLGLVFLRLGRAYIFREFLKSGLYDSSQSTVWALGVILVDLLSSCMAFNRPELALTRDPSERDLVVPYSWGWERKQRDPGNEFVLGAHVMRSDDARA